MEKWEIPILILKATRPPRRRAVRQHDRARQSVHQPYPQGRTAYHPQKDCIQHFIRGFALVSEGNAAAATEQLVLP